MGYLLYIRQEDVKGDEHGLGLGWLLAIALGGAVLLFLAIGFLLAWRIKARNQPCTTRVYANGDMPERQGTTTRLAKRRFLTSDYSTSRFSSRMSLTLPPILPPLPTYNSFYKRANRRRSRSWVDEDTLHGPRMNRSTRESWFSMDAWFGRAPTLPTVDVAAVEEGREPQAEKQQRQEITVQKRQSRPPLKTSQTAPTLTTPATTTTALTAPEEPQRGRTRVPAQAHVQPSLTDTDLRDILTLTEQRLRDGTSRSPTKTPRTSPKKTSPTKTPRSCRTVSSHGTARINKGTTPSPSKKAGATPQMGSRNASVSSIGSAANSLIAEATQQLELPGGMSSPSRLRGTEWESPKKTVEPKVEQRRRSVDSDVSSTLSTLYSVGDPEEGRVAANNRGEDPFVEKETAMPVPERNPRRRTQTMSAANLFAKAQEQSVVPEPLRPMSVNSQPALGRDNLKMDAWRMPVVLQPPTRPQSEDVGSKSPTSTIRRVAASPSETSMVTESVDSDSEPELPTVRTSHADSSSGRDTGSMTPRPSLGEGISVDMSSSPYDEQDILSLLMSSSQPKRALPVPPPRVDGTAEIATALSPRPKNTPVLKHSRKISAGSMSSSNYSDPMASSMGSPSRGPSRANSTKDTQAVGSTIAQLRRMNSMVSTYSVASLASTATIVGADADSPVLPTVRSGNLSPSRSFSSKIGTTGISSRHYFNIGAQRLQSKGATQRERRAAGAGAQLRPEAQDHGKENVGLGLRVPRVVDSPLSSGLREGRRSGNLGRDAAAGGGKAKLGPVSELMVEESRRVEQRESVESLYDKEGFLVGSPETEARGRYLRM